MSIFSSASLFLTADQRVRDVVVGVHDDPDRLATWGKDVRSKIVEQRVNAALWLNLKRHSWRAALT